MSTHNSADQLYTWTELVQILRVNEDRLRSMQVDHPLLLPDVIIPGGGRKAARWSASRIRAIQRSWSVAA